MHTKSESPMTLIRIEVTSRMDPERAAWLGNLSMNVNIAQDGTVITVLSGPVTDQAALFGILNRIRDLGLRLISVNPIVPGLASHKCDELKAEE
jgi:hypothetical protein